MRNMNINSKIKLIIIVITSFLMAFFPWKDFGKTFSDTERYIDRIIYLNHGGLEKVYSGIGYLFSEPLWKFYLEFAGNYFDNYFNALYILSFFVLIVFLNFMYKYSSFIITTIFICNPMFISLVMDQTRMATAISLLLIAYQLRNKKIILLLIFISSLIHGFSIIFVLIYLMFVKTERLFEDKTFLIFATILSFCIAIFMSLFVDNILQNIGGRRTQYSENMGSSVLYSFTWFAMSISIVLFSKPFINSNIKVITAYSVFMSSIYFYLSIVGLYGSRFFVASIPFIVISLNNLQNSYKKITISFIFLYQILIWNSWLNG